MGQSSWQEAVLSAGELYEVGGAVRDRLLLGPGAQESSDIDYLVRGIPSDKLELILLSFGRLNLVGKSFGVYKFTPLDSTDVIDIVYPRTERSTGTSHTSFDVHWDWRIPVEDDLRRRDFTINAIARNIRTGDIVDPCGGQADIGRRTLRMIFNEAFVEDPLRILRGTRFAARFGLDIEDSTFRRMASAAKLLSSLSPERVQEEMTRVLTEASQPGIAFQSLHEMGALAVILPELDRCAGVEQNEFHKHDVFVHSLETCNAAPQNDLLVRWSALMHDTGKVDCKKEVVEGGDKRVVFYGHEQESERLTRQVLERLKYPSLFVERCSHIVANHMFHYLSDWKDATVRRFIRKTGTENLKPLFALREADCRSREPRGAGVDDRIFIENLRDLEQRVAAELLSENAFHLTDLAVTGADVMRILEIGAGPRVGEILDLLLEKVTEDPGLNGKARLSEAIREMGA